MRETKNRDIYIVTCILVRSDLINHDLLLGLNNRDSCQNKFTEKLDNLIGSQYILLPDNMLHLLLLNNSMLETASRRRSEPWETYIAVNLIYPNPRNRLLACLKILNHLFAHIYQLHLPPIAQQFDPRNDQIQACFATQSRELLLITGINKAKTVNRKYKCKYNMKHEMVMDKLTIS